MNTTKALTKTLDNLPKELEGIKPAIEIDNYFRLCDKEEIYINLPPVIEAHAIFSRELKEINLINLNNIEGGDMEEQKRIINSLYAKLEYYLRVNEIYAKTKFLIENPLGYLAVHEELGGASRLAICEEDKQEVKQLIKSILAKIVEVEKYLDNLNHGVLED